MSQNNEIEIFEIPEDHVKGRSDERRSGFHSVNFEIIPFDETQAREALAAFDRYGKGIDPKARLNLADCAAYALAKTTNSPLLFTTNQRPN